MVGTPLHVLDIYKEWLICLHEGLEHSIYNSSTEQANSSTFYTDKRSKYAQPSTHEIVVFSFKTLRHAVTATTTTTITALRHRPKGGISTHTKARYNALSRIQLLVHVPSAIASAYSMSSRSSIMDASSQVQWRFMIRSKTSRYLEGSSR